MSGTMMTIIPLILLIVIMYFLMIRPQKKREKETTAMRNSVQVGDEIVTIGGICGKIVKTKDETIVIQVGADKVKMEMMRWSISKVVKEGAGHNKATADDYEEMGDAEEKETRRSKPKRMKKAAPVVEEEPAAAPEEAAEAAAAEVSEEAPAQVEDAADE
ncbi:MAG: preprotein translocase subunit YajC [Firmicutes bacterium]|nr:preprotein translocase subunit YajC [Bacillota bacterium]